MGLFRATDLKKIEKSLITYDAKREKLIALSREIIKASKIVINSIHRNNAKETELELPKMIVLKKKLDAMILKEKKFAHEGSSKIAYQEYAEAHLFYEFVQGHSFSQQTFSIPVESYLLGLCDVTGEMGRLAVLSATRNDYILVERIAKAVEEIHSFFIRLNLRNSELRKKSDAIKWNLKKLEDIMYDYSKSG